MTLRPLKWLFDNELELKTDTANYFEITLNITKDWNFYPNSNWDNVDSFELIESKGGLISIYPDHPDDQEHGRKSYYKLMNNEYGSLAQITISTALFISPTFQKLKSKKHSPVEMNIKIR